MDTMSPPPPPHISNVFETGLTVKLPILVEFELSKNTRSMATTPKFSSLLQQCNFVLPIKTVFFCPRKLCDFYKSVDIDEQLLIENKQHVVDGADLSKSQSEYNKEEQKF